MNSDDQRKEQWRQECIEEERKDPVKYAAKRKKIREIFAQFAKPGDVINGHILEEKDFLSRG
jgi:hypothetical protein